MKAIRSEVRRGMSAKRRFFNFFSRVVIIYSTSGKYSVTIIITKSYMYQKVPRHIVALDVLQIKNTVAQVILLSYHSLPLVKVTYVSLSYSLFSELSELFFYPPLLTSALFLESWSPLLLCLSLLLLNFCPTLRNFCLLFCTLAFLLKTKPRLYSSPAF